MLTLLKVQNLALERPNSRHEIISYFSIPILILKSELKNQAEIWSVLVFMVENSFNLII